MKYLSSKSTFTRITAQIGKLFWDTGTCMISILYNIVVISEIDYVNVTDTFCVNEELQFGTSLSCVIIKVLF